MTAEAFLEKVSEEMVKHDLHDWSLKFSSTKRIMGQCFFCEKEIRISRPFYEANKKDYYDEMWQTALHEIAHALAFIHDNDHCHGEAWRKWCGVVGTPANVTGSGRDFNRVTPKYNLINSVTDEIIGHYYRKPKRVKTHGLSFFFKNKNSGKLEHHQLVEVGANKNKDK